jgi:hypothetical protein
LGLAIVTVARTHDPDRFREIFEAVGSVNRVEHGCRSARLYFDPDDAQRAWSVFDWDAEDYQGFLNDPEIPLLARQLQLEGPPVHVTAVVELGV